MGLLSSRHQNVVRTSITHFAAPLVPTFLFSPQFYIICEQIPNSMESIYDDIIYESVLK